MTFWVVQILNGVSFGMLLFLLAAGLSLIYGLMRILNLAHGSYYLLGAYLALSVSAATGSFLLAALAAPAAVAALGVAMERLFLRRFPKQELPQVLLTFGFLFILADLMLWVWGGDPQTLPKPAPLAGSVAVGPLVFPTYRLLVIGLGALAGLLLWWFQERTRLGAMVRAGVDDDEMARACGINVPRLSTALFAAGAALAAFGGVIGGPFVGAYPGADFEVLLLAFVVVIVGGLGSLKGAFVGGLLVGLLDTFGKALFPQLALFTIFAPMALILAVRPTGLFGRR
ncbi:MAG TPA: branched-chain amino acid ABC transporter permease [Thermodesulfobacteriota bacterium]|nr:branched-chain amino acid ABC transporter permease [Thermodesulfobacteriota bacterium]